MAWSVVAERQEGHAAAETREQLELTGTIEAHQDHLSTVPRCTSTPISVDEEGASNTSLTALESAPRIAIASNSRLPELLPT